MFVRDGVLVTPDLTSGILESITRDALLVLAREQLGMRVEERVVDRTELYVADEVFLCGTAAEISPIVSVDKYAVGDGAIGPFTRELERAVRSIVAGERPQLRSLAHTGWARRPRAGVAFRELRSQKQPVLDRGTGCFDRACAHE